MGRLQYMGPKEKNRFSFVFKLCIVAVIVVILMLIYFGCESKKEKDSKINPDDIHVIQYQIPEDDAPVAIFETSLGDFKAVLYPDETPDFYKYFTKLVKEGYYDNTKVFAVQKDVYFMGGSKTTDGVTNSETDETNTDRELSPNLWPFKGSLIAYGNKSGIFSKTINSGSRILFVNSVEFDDDFKKQMEDAGGKEEVVDAFLDKGGVPNFSQQYTIFGQVYDGFEAYDKICGYDVKDSDNLEPIDEITIKKVSLSTYGENKNDSFFSIKKSSEKSDSKTVSKADSKADNSSE
ncbi:MAG: peptidylprolyl isomerase [Oscillospiraceae bacterium]